MAGTCAPEVAGACGAVTLSPRWLLLPKLGVFVLELGVVAKLFQCEELKGRNAPIYRAEPEVLPQVRAVSLRQVV